MLQFIHGVEISRITWETPITLPNVNCECATLTFATKACTRIEVNLFFTGKLSADHYLRACEATLPEMGRDKSGDGSLFASASSHRVSDFRITRKPGPDGMTGGYEFNWTESGDEKTLYVLLAEEAA